MSSIADSPPLVFIVAFAAVWLAGWIGWWLLRGRCVMDVELHDDFGVVLTAALTLLGLVIGFSFSMATSRYDQRKTFEEAEANAIGTEYLRADLLPPADATNVRSLLKKYLDERILFYTARRDDELQPINARTAELQSKLWAAVRGPGLDKPSPVLALAVSGMNDVLNSQGYTQAGYWNRIPLAAWCLMVLIAIGCNLLIGYGSRSSLAASRLLHILPIVVAVAFALIADIDSPRYGVIRVHAQNLTSLAESLPALNGTP